MAFPTTGILDNFNRDNEGPPPSTNWSNADGGLEVSSNEALGDTNVGNWSNWNVETFGADCECYVSILTSYAVDVRARLTVVDNTTTDGYKVSVYSNEVKIVRIDDGVDTQRGDAIAQTGPVSGDKLGIEIVGSTITAYFNDGGAGWGAIGNRSDETYSNAGYIGCRTYNKRTLDDFGGGTIAAGGVVIFQRRREE